MHEKPSSLDEGDDQTKAMQDRRVVRHFDEMTTDCYMRTWNAEHFHCGLFEPGEYPEQGVPFSGPPSLTCGLERMIEAIVAPVTIGKNHHVVDAGCGIGGTAIYLARTRGCTVTGVNLHRGQLEIAEERAKQAGLEDRVNFNYGNCSRHLPFASDSIDVVVNIESACHYSDRDQFLREVRRILKPGGRIVALDWLMRDGTTAEQYDRYIRPVCEYWALSGLESLSTYSARLRNVGLTVLECAGFDGKDIGNLQLIEHYSRTLKGLNFLGLLPARLQTPMRGFEALIAAWQPGFFETGRYCAEKPAAK